MIKPAAGPRITKPSIEGSDASESQKTEEKKSVPKKDVDAMVQELMPQALAAQGSVEKQPAAQDLSDAPEGGAVVQETAQDIPAEAELDQNQID